MLMQKQARMSLQDFASYVADNIKDYMPEEYRDAEVSIREVVKDNDTRLMAVDVRRSDERIVPSVYINEMYNSYIGGEDLDWLVKNAADTRIRNDAENLLDSRIVTNSIMDYETAKQNLVISICYTEWNRERMEGKVGRQVGEFTEFYRVAVNLDPDKERTYSSVVVTEDILEMWGISEEQLHADALLAEDARTPGLYSMDDLITEFATGLEPANLFDMDDPDAVGRSVPMFCLSTADKVNGAALMLRDDILSKAGEILEDNYFILPSSVHEVLLMPENTGFDPESLGDMVSSINQEQVMPQERLSDHVHYYDRENHLLINMHDGRAVSHELDNYMGEREPQEKKQDIPETDGLKKAKPHKRRGR